jgi:hypothetical protein
MVSISSSLARAFRVLERQSDEDPALAEAVFFMAEGADGPDDPFAEAPPGAVRAARVVNERRLYERQALATGASLDTAQVITLLRSVSDRRGVDRRRHRGQLLGWRSGTRTLHPSWQFDTRRGESRTGLARVLAALAEVTADPQVADELMRAPRDDLGGASLADLFVAGRIETVLRLIAASVEQS